MAARFVSNVMWLNIRKLRYKLFRLSQIRERIPSFLCQSWKTRDELPVTINHQSLNESSIINRHRMTLPLGSSRKKIVYGSGVENLAFFSDFQCPPDNRFYPRTIIIDNLDSANDHRTKKILTIFCYLPENISSTWQNAIWLKERRLKTLFTVCQTYIVKGI